MWVNYRQRDPAAVKGMLAMREILTFVAGLVSLLLLGAAAGAQEVITLSTRPGVMQSYFLASLPRTPQAIALLFPGSGGHVHLRQEDGRIKFSPGNFLIRTRSEFVKRGVVAAFIDAPSDMQKGWGMTDEFRLGGQHYTDMAMVAADLRKRAPNIPLFLVGTSRGTISAASLAARFGEEVSGAVLTATMFRAAGRKSNEPGPGLSKFDFATIKVSVLFVHHVSDQCASTPYGDAARLTDKYELVSVFGGLSPQSDPCQAHSAHGFFGKEGETVEQIVNWMLKRPFQHEVR
jgi:hypothetical protein